MKFHFFDNNNYNKNNFARKNLADDSCRYFFVYIYLELTEDQIKNQNGARLLSKTFSQQRPYYEKGYVFETDSLTLNEREYLENIHEKVSVEMHSGIIVHFNGVFFFAYLR